MFTDIIWRFLILETFAMGALCFTCPYNHPQKHFCESEYVLKVKLLEITHLPVGTSFRMYIITCFKGNDKKLNIMDNRYVNVETIRKVTLYVGKKYVIFGSNINGRIYTDLCDGILPWGHIKKDGRRVLSTFYKTGCECIEYIDNFSADKLCHYYYSYMKRLNGHCKWVKTRYFKRCLQEQSRSGK